jgi:hypothetical protein
MKDFYVLNRIFFLVLASKAHYFRCLEPEALRSDILELLSNSLQLAGIPLRIPEVEEVAPLSSIPSASRHPRSPEALLWMGKGRSDGAKRGLPALFFS